MKKIIYLSILFFVSNLYSQREFYELRKYELKWGTSQKVLNDYHRLLEYTHQKRMEEIN